MSDISDNMKGDRPTKGGERPLIRFGEQTYGLPDLPEYIISAKQQIRECEKESISPEEEIACIKKTRATKNTLLARVTMKALKEKDDWQKRFFIRLGLLLSEDKKELEKAIRQKVKKLRSERYDEMDEKKATKPELPPREKPLCRWPKERLKECLIELGVIDGSVELSHYFCFTEDKDSDFLCTAPNKIINRYPSPIGYLPEVIRRLSQKKDQEDEIVLVMRSYTGRRSAFVKDFFEYQGHEYSVDQLGKSCSKLGKDHKKNIREIIHSKYI